MANEVKRVSALVAIGGNVILYLMTAFCALSWDPAKWETYTRVILCVLVAFWWLLMVLGYAEDTKENQDGK